MPLLDRPHLVVELVAEVTFCDGAHPEGGVTTHPCRQSSSLTVVIPPVDDFPSWPPPADDERAQEAIINAITERLLVGLSGVILDLPGARAVLQADVRSDEGHDA